MNIQKFTQKSIEAVNQCEKLAYEYGNQQIEQEHLLYSLLTIEDSLSARRRQQGAGIRIPRLCQRRSE